MSKRTKKQKTYTYPELLAKFFPDYKPEPREQSATVSTTDIWVKHPTPPISEDK